MKAGQKELPFALASVRAYVKHSKGNQMKPREFCLIEKYNVIGDRNQTGFTVFDNPNEASAWAKQFVYPEWYKEIHVIEKSAYDAIEAKLIKMQELVNPVLDQSIEILRERRDYDKLRAQAEKLAATVDSVIQSDFCYGDAKDKAREALASYEAFKKESGE